MADISTAPTTGDIRTKTVRIDSDLSGKEYTAVDFDGTDRNVVNAVADGNTQGFILITAGDGSSTETAGVIVLSGRTKAELVGSVEAGDHLVPSTGGALVKNTTDKKFSCAVALEEGVSGDIISVEAIQGVMSV